MADATWYGSFRGGVENVGKAGDAKSQTSFKSAGTRWGVKGSNEISDGLSAVYRYETDLNLGTATLGDDNRLSYVGVSGGFGTITLGRIWSAGYNSTGAITDNSFAYGDSRTTYRISNALSYAVSAGNFSVQADVVMDPGTKKHSIDMTQIGVSVDAGIAKFALHTKELKADDGGTPATADANEIQDASIESDVNKTRLTTAAVEVSFGGVTAHVGSSQKNVWIPIATGTQATTVVTSKVKKKALHYGVRGSFGDSGINYLLQVTDVDDEVVGSKKNTDGTDADGNEILSKNSEPTTVVLGLSKSLGGGASVHFEHSDPDMKDKPKKSLLVLKVDF